MSNPTSALVPKQRPSRVEGQRQLPDPAVGDMVLGYGSSYRDQLGYGATTLFLNGIASTVFPEGVKIADVAAGVEHGLAATDDGRLFAWGNNSVGQVGDGTYNPHATPVEITIPGASEIVHVAAGTYFSMALSSEGEVFVWGSNHYGVMGNGTDNYGSTPTPIPVDMSWAALGLPTNSTVTAIAATDEGCIALTSTGSVISWGEAFIVGSPYVRPGLVPLPGTAVSITGGAGHSLVALADGTAYGWGLNTYGQVGNGQTGGDAGLPRTTSASRCRCSYLLARRSSRSLPVGGEGSTRAAGTTAWHSPRMDGCCPGARTPTACWATATPVTICPTATCRCG